MVFYRLKQSTGRGIFRWYPQYKRGDNAPWNNFIGKGGRGWRAYETPEEAQGFLATKNPKWQQYYEGEKFATLRQGD